MGNANKKFAKKLDFKNNKISCKIRVIHKIGKKNSILISVFGHKNMEKHSISVQKNVVKKNMLTYGRKREKTLCHYQRF